MIDLIKISHLKQRSIYEGYLENDDQGERISLDVGEKVELNLRTLAESSRDIIRLLSTEQLAELCNTLCLQITFFPSGGIWLEKKNPGNCEVKSCYITSVSSSSSNYLLCIALDETRHHYYQAELLGGFRQLAR